MPLSVESCALHGANFGSAESRLQYGEPVVILKPKAIRSSRHGDCAELKTVSCPTDSLRKVAIAPPVVPLVEKHEFQ